MISVKKITSFICTVILFVFVLACNEKPEPAEEINTRELQESVTLTAKDIEQIDYVEYVLSDTSEKATTDWIKFQEFQLQIEALKKGNLSFFKDDRDILKAFITDLKNEIPETLDESAIVVRLIALETSIYKLEGIATLHNPEKDTLLNAIKEVLTGHTNLIFQINKKFEKESQSIQKPN